MGTEAPELEIPQGQRHIIERPRLTKLLDESNARVILLVAPAGYGKTTLARQWVASRPHAWYTATHASADVAAFAERLSAASRQVVPSIGAKASQRLRAAAAPLPTTASIAELLVADLRGWPSDTWLVIDDYHLIADTPADEIVRTLLPQLPIRAVLASRKRPAWATARSLLYGQVEELGKASLALTPDETTRIFGDIRAVPEMAQRAEGWPALVGLALRAPRKDEPPRQQVDNLYAYLAEEVMSATSPGLHALSPLLAVAPALRIEQWSRLSPKAADAVAEAVSIGVAELQEDRLVAIHPLFKEFLASQQTEAELMLAARQLATVLIQEREWDAAFVVLRRGSADSLLDHLLAVALDPLLEEGRLLTLVNWLHTGSTSTPIRRLAVAEVEFRNGNFLRSQVAATEAARGFAHDQAWRSRSHYRAGMAAYSRDRLAPATRHLRSALVGARESERPEVLRALVVVELASNSPEAPKRLREYDAIEPATAADAVRQAGLRLYAAYHLGGIDDAIARSRPAAELLADVTDPMVRSSFRSNLTNALSVNGRYREALALIDAQRREIAAFHLTFAMVHSLLDEARAEAGVRRFRRSLALLSRAQQEPSGETRSSTGTS